MLLSLRIIRERIAETRAAAATVRYRLAARAQEAPAETRFADEMTRALAERDRQVAEVQHEADERLELLETVNAEADDRLRVMEEMEREIERLAAEIETIRRDQEGLASENEELRQAAEDRLALLEANDAAYNEFKQIMRGRLAELVDMLG